MTALPPSLFRRKNPNATAEQVYENGRQWRKRGLILPKAMLEDRRIVMRAVMQFAHQIRKEAAKNLGCRPGQICWSECLKLAWAEVKAEI